MTDRTPHADLDALVGRVQALEAGIHGLLTHRRALDKLTIPDGLAVQTA